ncbi:MAG: error-prone DNA polymerase [Chloroflexota bacterium]
MAAYVELHCHSYYSLLDGASSPEDLVQRASELEMNALGLTDHNAVYGVIPFITAAQKAGIQPIVGAEMTLEGGHHLTLLVENEPGWRNLCYLITRARHNAQKDKAFLPAAALIDHTAGLIALSGCRQGEIPQAVLQGRWDEALAAGAHYRALFGPGHFFIELQRHLLEEDEQLVEALVTVARQLRIGYVATNNVHYAIEARYRLQEVLVCIRNKTNLDESHHVRRPNTEYYLKSAAEMESLFADYPEALANTTRIAAQCRFELRYGLQDLPLFPTPGVTARTYLHFLCETALIQQYPDQPDTVIAQLQHEMEVIERSGLANYFLIVWDLVRFARENGILCQGRGSAANSLVAYLLGISPVDPIAHDLVFERFLSDERKAVPDIDIDFAADRREEVIQYLYSTYGLEHTSMACTFVTFRTRSAIRDVGKALGYPPIVLDDLVNRRSVDGAKDSRHQPLWELCEQIDGFPRHLGIHSGGMVITGQPLADRLPTEPATKQKRFVVQWDKDMLETAGIIKIDLLGLRMLSAVAEALQIVGQTTGIYPDLKRLSFDDPALFDLLTQADTVGVFQVESRAQAQVLPKLRPRTFNDIIISISLIRPGPVQGNMVHPYLRRRAGQEPVMYPHELLEPALEETLGVILFQETVLKVARDLAGFTAGEGEQLRRALSNKRSTERIEQLHDTFLQGAAQKDVLESVAEDVFTGLKAFGGYSFPKSHAAAFAVLVWESAWLKYYHPAAFYTALLNNQPMGFWSPAVIVNDARRHGIRILPLDINRSQGKCSVEGDQAIRLGFRYVDGLGEAGSAQIDSARVQGSFTSLADFQRRVGLPRRLVENLIQVGAMDEWGIARRKLIWELGQFNNFENGLPLYFPDDGVELPPLTHPETLAIEHQILGLLTSDHWMSLYQETMAKHNILGSAALAKCKDGEWVRIAGVTVMHQAPPTAKGYHFLTSEDEDGMMNVIIRPGVYAHAPYRRIIRNAPIIVVEGKLQREGDIINVLCSKVKMMPVSQ